MSGMMSNNINIGGLILFNYLDERNRIHQVCQTPPELKVKPHV